MNRPTVQPRPGGIMILLAVLLCLVTLPATAVPVARAAVGQGATWALHVDFDALRETSIGRQILAALETPEQKPRFLLYQTFLTFDPRRGLHGVTLYGPSAAPEEGVALIDADLNADKLVRTAELAEDHRAVQHGTNTIHHWVDTERREKNGGDPRTYAAIHHGRILIFGQNERAVAGALDVLDGIRPSLAASDNFPAFGKPEPGVFVQGVADKFVSPDTNVLALALRQVATGSVELKGVSETLQGDLLLGAATTETAGQISAVLRGLVAVLGLQSENPAALKLARGMSVLTMDRQSKVRLSLSAADVLDLLRLKP